MDIEKLENLLDSALSKETSESWRNKYNNFSKDMDTRFGAYYKIIQSFAKVDELPKNIQLVGDRDIRWCYDVPFYLKNDKYNRQTSLCKIL